MAAITLEELLEEVGVHPEKLDDSISDDHLREIALFLTSWRTVATYLELSESDLDAVERDGKLGQEKRLQALQKWKSKFAFKATYKKLVEVLLSLGMADIAEKVCLLVKGAQEPQLKDLVLVQVIRWYELGLQLGVEDQELQVIEHNNPQDLRACRRNMFRAWLRITHSPSYQQLVEALMAVGEGKEADLLSKKYSIYSSLLSPPPPPTSSTATPESETSCPRIGGRPEMWQLQRFVGVKGMVFEVVKEISTDWEKLALALHFRGEIIREQRHFQPEAACCTILQSWLNGNGLQPVTWETLVECLEDIGYGTLAGYLRKELDRSMHTAPYVTLHKRKFSEGSSDPADTKTSMTDKGSSYHTVRKKPPGEGCCEDQAGAKTSTTVTLGKRKSSEGSSWKDSTETDTSTTDEGSFCHAVTKRRKKSPGEEASKDQADTKTVQQRTVTLPELLCFRTASGSMLDQIGTHYKKLGILLLNDTTGTVTQAVIEQYHHNASEISIEIFQLWIQGKGMPVEWATLIEVLKDIGLTDLAREIGKKYITQKR